MVLIKGSHKLFAQMYMEGGLPERLWITYGGAATAESIKKMCQKGRSDKIYKTPYYTDIDCGAGFGGKLACYCLNSDEIIYVSK